MGRYALGASRLIILALVEADGESLDWARALRLHQGHHSRRIDAAGKERAKRHVGNHPKLDGIAQQSIESLQSLMHVGRRIIAPLPDYRHAAEIPETFRLRYNALPNGKNMPGRQLLRLAEDRARLRDIGVAQITDDRVLIDARRPAW